MYVTKENAPRILTQLGAELEKAPLTFFLKNYDEQPDAMHACLRLRSFTLEEAEEEFMAFVMDAEPADEVRIRRFRLLTAYVECDAVMLQVVNSIDPKNTVLIRAFGQLYRYHEMGWVRLLEKSQVDTALAPLPV